MRDTLFKKAPRVFVCGGRAVIRMQDDTFRVVCATCEAGGTATFKKLNGSAWEHTAARAAVRDSNKACRACKAMGL